MFVKSVFEVVGSSLGNLHQLGDSSFKLIAELPIGLEATHGQI